jgi:predicted nuclease of predicted toxin-antitoxin system
MPQTKLLLDTNTYFRLAKSIHPLLDTVFGEPNYCLYVLKELDIEFSRNKRLQSKFSWVDENEYLNNRRKKLSLSKKDKRAIDLTVDMLRQHKVDHLLSVSDIDILGLAYGHVLGICVVTDDTDMLELANVFGIRTQKTLNLLKLMLDCEHVDSHKVKQIVAYWEYIGDKPANFRQDYISLFGEKPP